MDKNKTNAISWGNILKSGPVRFGLVVMFLLASVKGCEYRFKRGRERARQEIIKSDADKRLQNMETGVVRGWTQSGGCLYDGALYVSALPSVAVNRKLMFNTQNNGDAHIKNNAAFFAAEVGDTICYLNPKHRAEVDCVTFADPDYDCSVISINGVPTDSMVLHYANRIRGHELYRIQEEFVRSLPRQR